MSSISSYGTKAGKLYRVRYRTPDGKQTQRRGFRTKREAQQFLVTVETSMLKGEYVAPTLGRATVGELGPAWLARQQGHLKASSAVAYERAWRVNVQPWWGATRVANVRFSAVQAWVTELSSTLGAESVKAAYGVLSRMLDDAVKDRMLATNPARGVKLPKPRRLSAPPHRAAPQRSGGARKDGGGLAEVQQEPHHRPPAVRDRGAGPHV